MLIKPKTKSIYIVFFMEGQSIVTPFKNQHFINYYLVLNVYFSLPAAFGISELLNSVPANNYII